MKPALKLVKDFEPLLTTGEVARILGRSRNRVREMPLPWVRVGGRLMLEPADLRKYLDERKENVA